MKNIVNIYATEMDYGIDAICFSIILTSLFRGQTKYQQSLNFHLLWVYFTICTKKICKLLQKMLMMMNREKKGIQICVRLKIENYPTCICIECSPIAKHLIEFVLFYFIYFI